MQKIRKEKNKNRKSWLIIIGSLLLLFGIIFIILDIMSPILNKNKEEELLEDFYIKDGKINSEEESFIENENTDKDNNLNYMAVLKIPKINLEKGLVSKNSKYNSIEYGIQILNESDSPDVVNGNVILAAHSGTAYISYFNNLDKINIGDEAFIIYNGKTYAYKFVNIYDVNKNGKVGIKKEKNTSTLTLITCRNNTNNQIVLIAELQI